MKSLYALLLILPVTQFCHADATLKVKTFTRDNSKQLTYYIKDGMLRFSEEGSDRINLYDRSKQIFISINQKDETISRIDRDILAQRTKQLNQQRLDRLDKAEAQLNEKLKNMSAEEQELATSLINKLKYPEFYGAHTFIEVFATDEEGRVGDYSCNIFNVKRETTLLKKICMAEAKTLGLPDSDYRTLRDFYHFNYQVRTQMMLAAGKTDFMFVDYEQENIPGIPIRIEDYEGRPAGEPDTRLLMEHVSTEMLDSSLFEGQIYKK